MFYLKILISLFFLLPAFGEKPSDVVIVNTNTNTNKATAQAPSQTVIAPALNPSKAKNMRNAREDAEVKTESLLLEKVEQERLKSEQNLLNKIFGASQQPSNAGVVTPKTPPSQTPPWMDRVYISAGVGIIQFYGKTNVESLGTSPCFSACFLSIGGSAQKHLLFDFNLSYSRHYLRPIHTELNYDDGYRTRIDYPMASMAVRLAPWTGKVRPYAGLSVAYIHSRESTENIRDTDWSTPEHEYHVYQKDKWIASFDGGLSGGMDITLGPNLGLNIDLRYHWNLDTEDTTGYYASDTGEKITNFYKAQSFIVSANLRFYF